MIKTEEILTTTDSKVNFMKGIIRITKSDGIIDEREKILFNQLITALNIPNEYLASINDCWDREEIHISFDNNRQKLFFIMQAIQLGWIDEDYSEPEKREIRKMASELGISELSVEKIETWVLEGLDWTKKGDALIELE